VALLDVDCSPLRHWFDVRFGTNSRYPSSFELANRSEQMVILALRPGPPPGDWGDSTSASASGD
jgi:hypothetical protein